MSRLFMVGDSTVSQFNDVSYYYPRFGYGELMNKYFNIEVVNYALSGRSSKSFLSEANYEKLFAEMKPGDYLMIGFGHNDQKSDDPIRFTDANKDVKDPSSFKYSLYQNYIKKAIMQGVSVILCTPIVRLDLNNKYEGTVIHQTANGDYAKAILELAKSSGVLGIDLTTPTLELCKDNPNALIYHAMTKGKKVNGCITFDPSSVDKTHLSYLGAYHVANIIAKAISKSRSNLRTYLKDDLTAPNNSVLEVNPLYVFKEYNTPDLENYNAPNYFDGGKDFYGTAFGTLDVIPNEKSGIVAKSNKDNTYTIGMKNNNGKFNASSDGFAYLFKRIDKKSNFEMSGDIEIISTLGSKQGGIGLMLRSDAYINQDTKSENYGTNYIASGLITSDGTTNAIFSRATSSAIDKGELVKEGFFSANDKLTVRLKRLGQVVDVSVLYENKEYKSTFTDFDILSIDPKYLFLGFFVAKGTVIKVSNVDFNIIGDALEA